MSEHKDLWTELCLKAAEKFDDIDKAEAWLDKQARGNRGLFTQRRAVAWHDYCRHGVYRAREDLLRDAKRAALAPTPGKCKRGLKAMAAASDVLRPLLDAFTLPDGRSLRSLIRSEVQRWSESEASRAKGHRHNAVFFASIEAKLPDSDAVVGDYVDDASAAKMWQEASE